MSEIDVIKAELREQARAIAADHMAWMDGCQVGRGQLARPADLTLAFGEYRQHESGWDWLYALSRAEQGRLRRNWFAAAGDTTAVSPDELDGLCGGVKVWLAETRIIDAAEAMVAGRPINPNLYGGLDVDSLFDTPYSVTALWHGDPEVAQDHVVSVNQRLHSVQEAEMDAVEQYRQAAALEAEAKRLRDDAVARLVAEGLSVSEIASRLGISRQAANQHVRRLR